MTSESGDNHLACDRRSNVANGNRFNVKEPSMNVSLQGSALFLHSKKKAENSLL